ncbi:MAG: DNA recombination protein RmuC [Bacilli bacterium]
MNYIFLTLLVVLIILEIINLVKRVNESNITERLGKIETSLTKEIGEFKNSFSHDLNKDFENLNDRIETRLNRINDRVNERLDVNFEKTNKTFSSVLERLARIDEAQKKIDNLSNDIVSLQSILTDKKSRGIFGEVNLKYILESIFGVKNDKIYQVQYSFNNNTIVDAVLFGPEPLGTIAIDSKFPLENYRNMIEKGIGQRDRDDKTKLFENDVKKHIDAISSKYIIDGVTSNQAIMFLPAEAIFAEINAYHPNIIKYAYQKRVWITSPTTLMSLLTVVQAVLMGMERDKYTSIIHEELNKLGQEFDKYKTRWDKLSRNIDSVSKDVKDIHITTEKITKRFDSINNVKIEDNNEIVLEDNNKIL